MEHRRYGDLDGLTVGVHTGGTAPSVRQLCATHAPGQGTAMTTEPGPMEPPRWNEVLRALREARGVTQEGWAAQLGVGRRTVQRWEQGLVVPDPVAEAAILSWCEARALYRRYD